MARKAADAPTPEDLGIDLPLETPAPVTPENEAPATGPDLGASAAEQPAPKRRGRPPGGGAAKTGEGPKKSGAKKATDSAALAMQLQGIHQMAAMMTGLPELQISAPEASMLATSLSAVADEYGLALSGKTGAAIQLFGVAAIIYLPRAIQVKGRIDAQKAAQKAEAEKTVDAVFVPAAPGEHVGPAH